MVSIRSYLVTRLLVGFVAVIGLGCALVYFISAKILQADFDGRLFAKAQAVIASTSQKGPRLDLDWSNLPKEVDRRGGRAEWLNIFDSTGNLAEGENFLDEKPSKGSGGATYANVRSKSGKRLRIVTLTFVPSVEEEDRSTTPSELRRPCLLIVGSNREPLDHSLRQIAFVLLALTVAASSLSLAMVMAILRRGLKPLETVSEQVNQIDESKLDQRISLERLPNEVSPIAEKLNELLIRLEVSFMRERQFSADVSHELRTPVAELKTLSEVMLQQPDLPPDMRQGYEDALAIACQMEALVKVLLEMVRHEREGSSLQKTEVKLEPAIYSAWVKLQTKARERNISLNCSLPNNQISVWTEPHLLSTVLVNLFDNAIEYSPEGTVVDVEWESRGDAIRLGISNQATNLDRSDLAHLFERFWRKDKARSGSEHFGIGLSLTRAICQRLGIHLTVSMDKGMIHFWLHLPQKGAALET